MFYISQMKQDDCGFASLKMLLANIYKNEDYLYLKQTEEHGPYNYFELIDIEKDYGLILSGCKATQKEEFPEFDEYPFLISGFIFNFRYEDKDIEVTYFQSIQDFEKMINKLGKKSFNEKDLLKYNPIKIEQEKKRVNYRYNVEKFLEDTAF
jgi:hypothetical protein